MTGNEFIALQNGAVTIFGPLIPWLIVVLVVLAMLGVVGLAAIWGSQWI